MNLALNGFQLGRRGTEGCVLGSGGGFFQLPASESVLSNSGSTQPALLQYFLYNMELIEIPFFPKSILENMIPTK